MTTGPDRISLSAYGRLRGIPKSTLSRWVSQGLPNEPGQDSEGRLVRWVEVAKVDRWIGDQPRLLARSPSRPRRRRPRFLSSPAFRSALIEALKDPDVRLAVAASLAVETGEDHPE